MAKYLVLAPHADDEVLGCGGTIARKVREGHEVYVSILTNASVGAPELFSEKDVQRSRAEAKNAHELLGVKATKFSELPAPRLEQYPQYMIANEITTIIKDVQPNVLLIPHRGDLHLDHGVIFNASLVAARPVGSHKISRILAYETLSETEWGHPFPEKAFIPNYFVPLSEGDLQKKLAAMQSFSSQIKQSPHPRSIEGIQTLAAHRGMSVNNKYAEAFILVREVEAE